MLLDQENLKKLKSLLAVANDGLSVASFEKAFKAVIEHTLKIELKLIEKINQALKDLKGTNNGLNKATQGSLSDLTAELNTDMAKALKDQKESLEFIYDKMRDWHYFHSYRETEKDLILEYTLSSLELRIKPDELSQNAIVDLFEKFNWEEPSLTMIKNEQARLYNRTY